MAAILILSFVTLQRLGELLLAARNTRALVAQGAYEVSPGHYPLIVSVHAGWLGVLWWLAPGQPVSWPLIALFALLQIARLWVIATLGPRWTTRIIILPGAPLITGGPYRFMRHPNYAVVVAEIALLPLAFGLETVAVVFTFLNAFALTLRLRAEDKALRAG
ncbi:isoprenylcysteine carboxyl methyltransferase family protein [Allosphingosinicella indica]|uniref:Methyltransferase n=1 Tax=Allosphingosinicella indica TaxID=941907 RepID=A0A1X7FZV2_9SPHN|nr:isoprenylcysteine carboxylmethyltransferase family protein [Allosphingosinicella indica]SMF61621.1 methyltransferase [Allosphingosinicella indica]